MDDPFGVNMNDGSISRGQGDAEKVEKSTVAGRTELKNESRVLQSLEPPSRLGNNPGLSQSSDDYDIQSDSRCVYRLFRAEAWASVCAELAGGAA
jgi:hypothetical protein